MERLSDRRRNWFRKPVRLYRPCEFDPRPLRLEGAPPARQRALNTRAGVTAWEIDTSTFRWPRPSRLKGPL
jgi:hypothetical protein